MEFHDHITDHNAKKTVRNHQNDKHDRQDWHLLQTHQKTHPNGGQEKQSIKNEKKTTTSLYFDDYMQCRFNGISNKLASQTNLTPYRIFTDWIEHDFIPLFLNQEEREPRHTPIGLDDTELGF